MTTNELPREPTELDRLVAAARDGDRPAFDELVRRTYVDTYSLAMRLTAHEEDARDVVQETYLRAWKGLKGFRGDAQFTTWLRVVVRNLCLDWHRKEFGRHRVFQSIARLGALEQEIFRCIYEQGLSQDESLNFLRASYPSLRMAELEACMDRVRSTLTARQIWLAGARRRRPLPLEHDPEGKPKGSIPEIIDPAPSAESLLVMKELQAALERALSRLSKPERLLTRLRFERGLTLQETASLMGLKDAQTVDRRQRDIIEKLRKELADFSGAGGKN